MAERRASQEILCTGEAVVLAGCVFVAMEICDRQEAGG